MGSRWLGTADAPEGRSAFIGDWPYVEEDGDKGLPQWFFGPFGEPHPDLFLNYIEIYADGTAVWTGGHGVIWKRPGGADIPREQLGRELDAWSMENL